MLMWLFELICLIFNTSACLIQLLLGACVELAHAHVTVCVVGEGKVPRKARGRVDHPSRVEHHQAAQRGRVVPQQNGERVKEPKHLGHFPFEF